jgi:hypothetical protein
VCCIGCKYNLRVVCVCGDVRVMCVVREFDSVSLY